MFWATFDHFWSFLPDGDSFQKIRLSHTAIYWSLTPCWVSEKTNEPILRKLTDRQKDRWTERWKDRRRDTQTLFYRVLLAEAGGPKICFFM